MQMSPSIAAAIVAVCRDVRQLGADDRNKHGGYNFVSVDKFYAAIGPVMAKHGLATFANVARSEIVESVNDEGKTKSHLHMEWELYLIHEDGSVYGAVRRDVTVIASGPQAYAAAESFVTKYFIRSTFKIPTVDKDDADLHEQEPLPQSGSRGPNQTSGGGLPKAVKGVNKMDEAVLSFMEEIQRKLDSGISAGDFFRWSGETKNSLRLRRIREGEFDHLPGVAELTANINRLYASEAGKIFDETAVKEG